MTAIAIETAIFAGFAFLFVVFALAFTRAQDAGVGKWRAVIGAAIEGMIIGAIFGYILAPGWINLVPFSFRPPEQVLAWQSQAVLAPAFVIEEIVRNGALARFPGLAYFLRPRWRAVLIRRKRALERRLSRFDAPSAGEPAQPSTA